MQLYKKIMSIHSIPLCAVLLIGLISIVIVSTFWLGFVLWQIALLIVLVWSPLFFLKTAELYRQYRWLALFFILVMTQGGHFVEHLTQMIQIHVLGLSGQQANGIFGMLNLEWVHFIWNSWVLLFVLLLLYFFRFLILFAVGAVLDYLSTGRNPQEANDERVEIISLPEMR
jgi:hypothetical protein